MTNLPHLYPIGASFFITFRLADSLPQSLIKNLNLDFELKEIQIQQRSISEKEKLELLRNLSATRFMKFDNNLDKNPFGKCWLQNNAVAKIVWDKIFQYENEYYNVEALAIMPNHVHLLVDTSIQSSNHSNSDLDARKYVNVPKWLQLIKGGSAFLINKHLNQKGTLWQKESFDRFIRPDSKNQYDNIKQYILQNPMKAGLDPKFLMKPFLYSKNDSDNIKEL